MPVLCQSLRQGKEPALARTYAPKTVALKHRMYVFGHANTAFRIRFYAVMKVARVFGLGADQALREVFGPESDQALRAMPYFPSLL